MSIEGSINVSALFHDKDGTTAMKVVSLRSSNEYTTGKVAIITGTAGTAQTTIVTDGVYRDASGSLVTVGEHSRILFSWSNPNALRRLEAIDLDDVVFCTLCSRGSEVAAASVTTIQSLRLTQSSGNSGTYTIVLLGI